MIKNGIDFFMTFLVVMAVSVIICLLFGWVGVILWNCLMPAIFGLSRVGYWQMVGLMLLIRILFPNRITYSRN